jgi:hypothetical protein
VPPTSFLSTFLAGAFDKDPAHGFRGSGKEVPTAVPVWLFVVTN